MCISSGFESRIPLWRLTFSTFREFPRSLLIPCSHGHANWELSILLIGHFFAKDGRMEHQRVVTMFWDMILFFNVFFQCVYVFKNTRMIHIIMMYYILYIYSNIYIYSYWGGICYSPEEDIQLSCGSKNIKHLSRAQRGLENGIACGGLERRKSLPLPWQNPRKVLVSLDLWISTWRRHQIAAKTCLSELKFENLTESFESCITTINHHHTTFFWCVILAKTNQSAGSGSSLSVAGVEPLEVCWVPSKRTRWSTWNSPLHTWPNPWRP